MSINTSITEYAIITIFIVLFVAMSIFAPNFLTGNNTANVLRQVSINGICAIDMTLVILTGGIDLSTGAIVGISGVLTATAMINNVNPIIASLISLALYTLIRFAAGPVISHIRVPPMVAVIEVMTFLHGVAHLIMGGIPISRFDSRYAIIGQGYVGVIPMPVIILVLLFAVGMSFLSKAGHSRYIYGVGGSEEVARLSGISAHRIKVLMCTVSGFCSVLTGLVVLGRLNSGQPRAGESYEMDVIMAVVLGGASLTDGVGKISHVVFGVLIIGALTDGVTIMAADDHWQRAVEGSVLLLAVGFNRFIQERQQKSE